MQAQAAEGWVSGCARGWSMGWPHLWVAAQALATGGQGARRAAGGRGRGDGRLSETDVGDVP